MKTGKAIKTVLVAFILLCPGMCWGDWSVLFFDDFESYSGITDLRASWKDRSTQAAPKTYCYAYPKNDQSLGSQSMYLDCWNSFPPKYSEVRHTFAEDQDWSATAASGVRSLAFSVYGTAANPADYIYVRLEDSDGGAARQEVSDANAVKVEAWTELLFALNAFDGVNLAKISKIIIGVGPEPPVSVGSGTVKIWVDNVRLYPAGRMVYVDDDAPNDPGPGDPGISDPNENGTEDHPFDTIQEGIDAAQDSDTVLVHPGQYLTADPEIEEQIDFGGKNITLTSTNPADPNIVNNTIIGGTVRFSGTEDPSCTLTGFTVRHIGFGAIYGSGTQATISHCNISGNGPCYATVIKGCDGTISNCLITDNTTIFRCGVNPVIFGCDGLIKNCTIANNISGVIALDGDTMTLENCIIYDNNGVHLGGGSTATLNVSYCDIQGGLEGIAGDANVNWGPGNIDADPCFARLGEWGPSWELDEGDYHLKSERGRYWPEHDIWVLDGITSPCVDGGDPMANPIGEPVPNGGRINMGAYGGTAEASMSEWPFASDINRDGIVDMKDLAILAGDWLRTTDQAN